MLSDDTIGRLQNWKFSQAEAFMASQVEPATETEISLVEALSVTFGNPGWFDGGMSVIISAALSTIVPAEPAAADTNSMPYTTVWVGQEDPKVSVTRPATQGPFAPLRPALMATVRPDGGYLLFDFVTGDEMGTATDIPELVGMMLTFAPPEKGSYRQVVVQEFIAERVRAYLAGGESDG